PSRTLKNCNEAKQIAIEKGHIIPEAVSYITEQRQKLLFLRVRNKACTVCCFYKSQEKEIKKH
ncbi:hypothetical protein ILUMI_05509, partial [Ignelater luminosus]